MTRLTYIFVGLMFGGLTFLTTSIFGSDLAPMIMGISSSTPPQMSGLAGMLAEPIAWLMLNPTWGAVVIGALWPVALFWFGLTGLVGMIGVGYGTAFTIGFDLGLNAFF